MKLNVRFKEDSPIPVKFRSVETETRAVVLSDYEELTNKPSINGVVLIGNKTSEDLGIGGGEADFPEEGFIGDILTKTGTERNAVSWVTPASNAEADNTRPITAAAVYTEIGNINALLATI